MSNRVSPEPPFNEGASQQQQQQFENDLQHFIAQQQPGDNRAPAPEPFQPEKPDVMSLNEVDGSKNNSQTDLLSTQDETTSSVRKRRNQKPSYQEVNTDWDDPQTDFPAQKESDSGSIRAEKMESDSDQPSRPPYTPAPPAFLPPLDAREQSSEPQADPQPFQLEGEYEDRDSAYTGVHRGAAPTSTMSQPRNSAMKDSGVIGANENAEDSGCCAIILTVLSYMLVVLFFPLSLCATIKVVQEYERAVIFRLGRLLPGGAKGPGIFFVMPCIEEYTKVDLRTVSFDVPPQEVLTRDSVTVSVDAVVYYRISNPTVSVANVENAANSTQLLAQTTLRNVLGTQNLAEILSNREHISEQMQNALDDATDKWGIKVERVEIKDVRLPTQLQRAMAAEAEAARDARAKVIAAEGEQKASVALKEAADIIANSPAALQLRYLQTLTSISAEKNSTIIFPLPIEMVQGMLKR